jgi:hypothetical protein
MGADHLAFEPWLSSHSFALADLLPQYTSVTESRNEPETEMSRLTVSAAWLLSAAKQLERDANQSLPAWILLQQAERYPAAMAKARTMRRAAEMKSIAERREYLRNSGIEA